MRYMSWPTVIRAVDWRNAVKLNMQVLHYHRWLYGCQLPQHWAGFHFNVRSSFTQGKSVELGFYRKQAVISGAKAESHILARLYCAMIKSFKGHHSTWTEGKITKLPPGLYNAADFALLFIMILFSWRYRPWKCNSFYVHVWANPNVSKSFITIRDGFTVRYGFVIDYVSDVE